MKRLCRIFSFVLALVLMFTAVPVKADENASISVNGQSEIYLKPGELKQLEVVKESFGDTNTITWTINEFVGYASEGTDPTVDETGVVTAGTRAGFGSVKAVTDTGSEAVFQIYVYDEPASIKFNQQSYFVNVSGGPVYIKAMGDAITSQNIPYTLTFEDPSLVQMTDTYYMKGIKTGTTTVTATYENNLTVSAEVTVVNGEYADSIQMLSGEPVLIQPGETKKIDNYKLVSDSDASKTEFADEKITWSVIYDYPLSGSENVVTVDQKGNVTAHAYGEASVQAAITNGRTVAFFIRVSPVAEGISFIEDKNYRLPDSYKANLYLGDYVNLEPEGARVEDLVFTSSDPSVIQINDTQAAILKAGTATITAVSGADAEVKASHVFEIYETVSPAAMELSAYDTNVYAGYTYRIAASYQPDAADTNTSWKVDNTDTAYVNPFYSDSSYCQINVKQPGVFTVTATSDADPNLIRTMTFTAVNGTHSTDLFDTKFILGEYGKGESTVNPEKFYMELGRSYRVAFVYTSDKVVPGNVYASDPAEVYAQIPLIEEMEDVSSGVGFYEDASGLLTNASGTAFTAVKTGSATLTMYGRSVEMIVVESLADVEVEVEAPVVENEAGVDAEVVEALNNAGDMGIGDQLVNSFDVAALQESIELPETAEKAVVRTFVEIKATEYTKDAATNNATLVLDITPKYEIVAVDGNNQQVGEVLESGIVEVTEPVTMSIPVGNMFDENITTIYIRHKKNGKTYQYEGKLNNGVVTFVNPHGFSEFTLSAVDTIVATISDAGYESFQEAIGAAQDGETITVTAVAAEDFTAAVGREMTVTIDNQGKYNVSLTPADGYEMTVDGNTYTFKKKAAPVPAEEETPAPPAEEVTPSGGQTPAPATHSQTNPPTGDRSGIIGYSAILFVSVMTAAAVLWLRRRYAVN